MQVLRRAFFFPRGANNRESLLELNCTILTQILHFNLYFGLWSDQWIYMRKFEGLVRLNTSRETYRLHHTLIASAESRWLRGAAATKEMQQQMSFHLFMGYWSTFTLPITCDKLLRQLVQIISVIVVVFTPPPTHTHTNTHKRCTAHKHIQLLK